MLNKKFQKCVKLGFSILVSTMLIGTSSILSCFATTKEAIAPSKRFGDLSVIIESNDNTIPEDNLFGPSVGDFIKSRKSNKKKKATPRSHSIYL